jgi:hypothetical protein
MKFQKTNNNGRNSITFDYYDKDGHGGGYVVFYNVPGNCKMTFIEQVNGIFNGTREQWKAKLDYVLSESYIVVSLNTNNTTYAEWIRKTYELYAYNEVPVGYHNGYQYHIIIRNTLSKAPNTCHMRPVEKKAVKVKYKEDLKGLITGILKKHRRKTDIAISIAKAVQDNTEG